MRGLPLTRPLLPLAPPLALAALAYPWLLAPACLAAALAGLQPPGLRPPLPPNAIRGTAGTPLHATLLLTALAALPPHATGVAAAAFLITAAVLGCRMALSTATVLAVDRDTLVVQRLRGRPRRIPAATADCTLRRHFPAWRSATLRIRHRDGTLVCGPFHRRRLQRLLPPGPPPGPSALARVLTAAAAGLKAAFTPGPKGTAPLDPFIRSRPVRALSRHLGRRRPASPGTPPPPDAPPP